MNRTEFLRALVLRVISDDYESFDKIATDVAEDSKRAGLPTHSPEILAALIDLIEAGLAKAYRLSTTEPAEEIQGVPPREEIFVPWHCYFLITKKGIEVLTSNRARCWPFDDEGALREDWSPPAG